MIDSLSSRVGIFSRIKVVDDTNRIFLMKKDIPIYILLITEIVVVISIFVTFNKNEP